MTKAKEFCGLFGVFGTNDAAELTYQGLFAQQHRGQESAGIAVIQNGKLAHHKGMGLVHDVFTPENLAALKSHAAIGHTRYSTTGSSDPVNAQPLVVETSRCPMAVAHNGNLVNSAKLRRSIEAQGQFLPIFHTSTDTEIILYLAARSPDLIKGLKKALRLVRGAFSLLFLTPRALIVARDTQGFRPLALGKRRGAWAAASETCAFDLTGFKYQRDVAPGEIVIIDRNGVHSERFAPRSECEPAHCLFEHVYFARPDSRVHGSLVHEARRRFGWRLSLEHPVEADFVTPVPDSGLIAAEGYSEESGLLYKLAYVRNHYVGRTFIQPGQNERASSVSIKLAVIRELVKGKRIVVVDDSIIRGTTSRSRIRLLRDAGAREVHFRISCPPTRFPCYYGIDFPSPGELIASNRSIEKIRRHIGADTLGYLSLEGMLYAVGGPVESYCTACWSGCYRLPVEDVMKKDRLEKTSHAP